MKILRTKYTSYARHHEDLAQEAMAAVFKSMGDYNAEKGTLNAYVHGVAARAISKNVRTIIRRESKESELTEAVLSMTGEEDRRWEDGESPEAQEAEFEQLKQRITKAATDAVNDAEQKDKTGEEKKEIAVTQVFALIPAIYKPIITRAVVEGIVQAAFDKIEEYAKKQADKKKTK